MVKVVAGVEHSVPVKAKPLDVFLDGLHIFHVFLGRIGVVKAEVALPLILFFHAKVDAQCLGVADVQIAVGLRGESGDDFRHFTAGKLVVDDFFDKVS